MPAIPIADKATLDQVLAYVDTLEALVGTANPASGDLLTLFKGLKLIADYVDTLETKVGTNADAAGTNTLFARLAQIAGYTDQVEGYVDTLESVLGTVNTSVGSNADASSSSGSVHAKLKDLKSYTVEVHTIGQGNYNNMASVAGTWYTVINVTGKGKLFHVAAYAPVSDNGFIHLKITIDGTAYTVETIGAAMSNVIGFDNLNFIRCFFGTKFDTSLKVEVMQNKGTYQLEGTVDYGLI